MLLKVFAVMSHVENVNIPLTCKFQLPKYHQHNLLIEFSLLFTTDIELWHCLGRGKTISEFIGEWNFGLRQVFQYRKLMGTGSGPGYNSPGSMETAREGL